VPRRKRNESIHSSERTPRQVFLKFDGPRGAMSDPVFPFLERRPAYDGDIALEGVDLVYDTLHLPFRYHMHEFDTA
jgi:hypothetical protein